MAIEILPGDENSSPGRFRLRHHGDLVGADRGFITREQGAERMLKIVRFLARADRSTASGRTSSMAAPAA